jgi:hypothetical protein
MVDEPRQFHVVPLPATFDEDRHFCAVIAARYAAVDVQLSGNDLANDEAFAHEYGDPIGRGRYRHRSLADKLGVDGIARVRRFVADLLCALTGESDRFVWFLKGSLRDDLDDEHSDNFPDAQGDRLLVSGWVDEAALNGSFVLFGGEREDLAFEAQRLGHYDCVRGIAGPRLSLASVLAKLTLANPLPTSSVRLSAGPNHLVTLDAVLTIAALFFEEINNGTRLRLVSGTLSREQIETTVAVVRAATR